MAEAQAANDHNHAEPALHPEVEARMDEGAAVLSFFSTFGWVSSMEFDEKAEAWRNEPEQVCRPGVFTAATTFAQLETLCVAGIIEARARGGGRNGVAPYVEYRLVRRVKH
jgi:hypothetical protein